MDSLNDLKIEEVFSKEKAKEYEARFKVIWDNLVTAHSSMFVVEKVRNFPRHLLLPPYEHTFLSLVGRNFSHQAALTVINMLTDKDERSATFKTFTKWIRNNCLPEVSDKVSTYLDQINSSEEVKSLQKRAWKLRSKLLAHLDWEYILDPSKLVKIQITPEELHVLVSETEKALSKLCVEGGVSLLPLEYSPLVQHPKGSDPRSDIERFLDLLAADSHFLNMPEEQPCLWEGLAKDWTEEKKEVFNHWRRKIGKSVVS